MSGLSLSAGSVLDALVFHDWPSTRSLTPYMSAGYREWFERESDPFGPIELRSQWRYDDPRPPRAAASDFDALRARLDATGIGQAVLAYHDANLITGFPNHYPVRVMVNAANQWLAEQRLAADPRLFGLVMLSTTLPDEAAEQVRRFGANERFVGVSMGANALGRPFGDPLYHPIYRAAAELGLPIVVQVGSDSVATGNSPPVAGGLPCTFAEVHALGAQSNMTHAASLITQGVFDLFPDLRVLLVGGGATWVPAYVWRLNFWFKMYSTEMPWMKALPDDYFRKHFYISTFQLEKVRDNARLARALGSFPGMESMLVYGSGFPSPDAEDAEEIAERLPEEWHAGVFAANAANLFRWPGGKRAGADAGLGGTSLLEMSAAEAQGAPGTGA
jgi:predicted TIM-barrel fold metal-dependent hydrolase